MIRFIEKRFAGTSGDLIESNITPWRRAVAGDLTSVFDFTNPNAWQNIVLPDTESFEPNDFVRHRDQPPKPQSKQTMPLQETGQRLARALPYTLHAHGSVIDADGSFGIDFVSLGDAGAVFQVRSARSAEAPRTYTVEAHKSLSDTFGVFSTGANAYDLSVYGPSGFLRRFKGTIGQGGANLETRASYDVAANAITLAITNRSGRTVTVRIADGYSGTVRVNAVNAGASLTSTWVLSASFGWYDLTVTVEGDAGFENHLAGHLENGQPSRSDPRMGVTA